ncbi:MAG: exodeoxyribonuclease V subunit gamma [Solirubrobacterales bacterium]|nr:exodeoxyribonuclease V subunit gamma [Solirubrobacterales bacterium]
MLHLHRAERADRLADGLAETLAAPLADPFAPDVVAVPTRGVERWLAQRLSTRLGTSPERSDGVCANVEFPFPGRLVLGSLAAATGVDPEQDPWAPERSVWPLLDVVDRFLGEPWLDRLERHLRGARGDDHEPIRRFGVVRHVADLLDRYGLHRPAMVRAWAAGADPEEWQAELWRRLRARIGGPSPAERLPAACERIRRQPELLELPPRLALFGLTRIPRSQLDVVAAIAHVREVHVFVLHPSPALWSQVSAAAGTGGPTGGAGGRAGAEGPAAGAEVPAAARHEDRTARLAVNRLLASWGRDARELQLVVASAGPAAEHHHGSRAAAAPTLLERIQADIWANRQPPGPPLPGRPDARPRLAREDRSLQVHACHGRARQVEVLRDAVLHLFAEDATLEPRDVIVMCPDIEAFAPLIQATFGAGRADDDGEEPRAPSERPPDLRVRLADRALRQTNPVLTVVSQLLELADQRATASQLLDLAAREPVRRRFHFDDDDLSRMQEWVADSGIRWGLDARHREPYRLSGLTANTWRRGLERILLGVAMSEEDRRMVAGVLPLDDVESGAIALAGRLAEYVERVRAAVDELAGGKPLTEWTAAIARAADALTATNDRDAWQRAQLQRVLDEVGAEAADGRAALELADVRAVLADRLRGRPTRANFRTGHLTICTLVPMRSVPHRVVCVLGLDDGEFPRRTVRDGDDLMLAHPHVGDRDPRSEDRQLLLDALLAATERMIITYTGNDERTNLRRPPAVPVGELLEAVERTVRAEPESAREQVLTCHPLQPFDPRNFSPGRLVPGRPWSFDPQSLAGARALVRPRRPPAPFLANPLPPPDPALTELNRLVRFAEHPVRALLRDRMGIAVGESLEEISDAIPVELDALAEWSVGQRLLDGVLAGAGLEDCLRAELARGLLPPAELARSPLAAISAVVEQIAARAGPLAGQAPASVSVNLALPGGRSLTGTITGVIGDTLRAVSYSRVRPPGRLAAWVRLLALSAAWPERRFESVLIGRARATARDAQVTFARIPPLAEDARARAELAVAHLEVLLDLYARGMREPLPLAAETSAAYAHAVAAGEDGERAARAAWETMFRYDREDRRPEHRLVYGEPIPLARLMAAPPRADERWAPGEPTRFGQYARRLWDGLLAHERLSDR